MESTSRPEIPRGGDSDRPAGVRRHLSALDVQIHRLCDALSEAVLLFMVVFTPWAFGTTQPWAIWTMNACGYVLGIMLLIKVSIRHRTSYQPPAWTDSGESAGGVGRGFALTSRFLTKALAMLRLAVLAYCLLSAANARRAL